MRREILGALLGLVAAAGLSLAFTACNGDENRGDGSDGDTDGDGDGDTDGDSDSDTGPDECADYRTEYPAGPYGTAVNSVIADIPNLVDGTGASHNLFELFQDKSVVAIAIANAFDT
jgi:hypothetical protein